MTRAERRQIIYKGAESIELGNQYYCCVALVHADHTSTLMDQFVKFYHGQRNPKYISWWRGEDKYSEKIRHERIMALLFFEVAG